MQAPPVAFSHWIPWKDRKSAPGIGFPGVYALARFPEDAPDGPADPFVNAVVYIGETCKSLKERWYQFERSAFEGKFGHSGGATYREIHWTEIEAGDRGNCLYVSAFPVSGIEPAARDTFIRFVERKLLWEYYCRHNGLPECNHK